MKLIRGFTIGAGNTSDFTIDFDLRRSVIRPPGQNGDFTLKPVLRVVDNLQVGTLAGVIAPALIDASCEPAIYVFAGNDVTPNDLGSATEPLVTGRVLQNATSGAFEFRIGFVPVGPYTVALTCESDLDSTETDDAIVFIEHANISVNAGRTATANIDQG